MNTQLYTMYDTQRHLIYVCNIIAGDKKLQIKFEVPYLLSLLE